MRPGIAWDHPSSKRVAQAQSCKMAVATGVHHHLLSWILAIYTFHRIVATYGFLHHATVAGNF